jgi:hypothetical protein
MQKIFLTIFICLFSILLSAQQLKCGRCKGTGKVTAYAKCKNCINWNSEYRKKVACNVCKDERYANQIEKCSEAYWGRRNCKNGYISLDKSAWSCIVNYNNTIDVLNLREEGEYIYEQVDNQQNGRETIFMYYKDGKVIWAYDDDKLPILFGKWECRGQKAYLIKWSDGQITKYGVK